VKVHDVVVCGAGPAGSLTALLLARAGVGVLLLDRAKFPRDKLCGDTINPGALAILRRHGLAGAVDGARLVDGMIVTGASGIRIVGRYGDGITGCAILRRDFDARICAAAVAAGAQLEEGVLVEAAAVQDARGGPAVAGVRVKRGGDTRAATIAARVVIVADGAGSRIARALRLSCHPPHPRRWAVSAYFTDVQDVSTFGEMHVRRDRYIGVAPLPGGLTNACVVTANRALLRDQQALLASTLQGEPLLADRFEIARLAVPPACIGPLAVDCRVPGMPGLLMAGDAAGFIDPMTGDGLRFALRGAELAAAETLRALDHGWAAAHLRLASARSDAFAGKWRFNRALRALVASPAAVGLADRGAAVAPSVLRRLVRYAADLRAA
jgi:flavin-dependent dehydrogenase